MSSSVTIVNYGLGNISAFQNIYDFLGISCNVGTTVADIKAANRLILPGVGSFDSALSLLNASGLRESIENAVISRHVPILGICVGMQIMCLASQEGYAQGLGWFDAQVISFKQMDSGDHPLPHMGWNSISNSSSQLFTNLDSNPYFYFLHSYLCVPKNKSNCSSTCTYCSSFCSSLHRDNIYAVQFHPEKSHDNGKTLLGNFSKI